MPRRTAPETPQLHARTRHATIILPEALLRQACALKVNVSPACQRGLAAEVASAKAREWQEENRPAMDAWNDYAEQHGLPLAQFRQF